MEEVGASHLRQREQHRHMRDVRFAFYFTAAQKKKKNVHRLAGKWVCVEGGVLGLGALAGLETHQAGQHKFQGVMLSKATLVQRFLLLSILTFNAANPTIFFSTWLFLLLHKFTHGCHGANVLQS